jgi:hypothetical protein
MNKRLFSAVAVLFLLLVGWILNDLGIISIPFFSHGDSNNQALGVITQKVKNVQRRAKDSLTWEDVASNEKVFGYDSVLTLENSTAFIKMKDGIDLNVDQNSLITILPPGADQDALTLNLKSGSYKVSLRKGSHLKVGGVAFNSGGDSALDFKAGPDSQIHMTVIAGAVDVVSPGPTKGSASKRVPAAAGQAYTIDSVHSLATLEQDQSAPVAAPVVAENIPPAPPAAAPAVVAPVPAPAAMAAEAAPPPAPAPVISQEEAKPVVHKARQARQKQKSVPIIEEPKSITQSAVATGPGAQTQAEEVAQRPDPEAMSQDLSELPAVAVAGVPAAQPEVANQQTPAAATDNAQGPAPTSPEGAQVDHALDQPVTADHADQPDQPAAADMAPQQPVATDNAQAPEAAAAADTQAYDSEMAKTNEPEKKQPEENASDWAWRNKGYTLWVGSSLNYSSYTQDSTNTSGMGTQNFGIPNHFTFQARPSETWGFNLFYENVGGAPGYSGNITNWNYNRVSYGAEVTYVAKRNMDSQGVGSEMVITLGAEEMTMPFLSALPGSQFNATTNNEMLLMAGIQYNTNHNKRLRYEFDAHFLYPVSASAANSDSFSLQPQYGFEASAGLVYRLTPHLFAGTDLRAEYFSNGYSFSSPSLGTSYSGNQTFLDLTFELKLGYSF